jgi:hypothetical protein
MDEKRISVLGGPSKPKTPVTIERKKSFFQENPHYFGIVFVLIGILILVSAIIDAHWLFGDVSDVTYNLDKIDGWVNMFGREIARVLAGIGSIVLILAGIYWYIVQKSRRKTA